MHITPEPFSMTIARVRELVQEMSTAATPVVCSFTREQLVDLLADVDMRTRSTTAIKAPPPLPPPPPRVTPLEAYVDHRRSCPICSRGEGRCDAGQSLYATACVGLVNDAKMLL